MQSYLPRVAPPGRDLFGSSPPSMFVGRHGYPNITVGPMLPPEHLEEGAARHLDDPASWMDTMAIADVVGLRSSLVRTTHAVRVDQAAQNPDRITRLSQELAVAARPVDTEVHLSRVPRFSVPSVGDWSPPHGPTAEVERAQLAENVRVERRMEYVTGDTDLRAGEGLVDLYQSGISPYQLERVLSAGMLGQARRRRLVPTRWSITATDDTLGRSLTERVRDLPTLDKPVVHFAQHFGNRFHVILVPRPWGFDNVEVWLKGAFWAREVVPAEDWEDYGGRTTYAANTTGGYYATRLSVLEHLTDVLHRQATAIVLREITDEYTTPLGVWVVREACRRAMQAKPLIFEELEAALRHVNRHAHFKQWQQHAELLQRVKRQTTLDRYS